MANKKKKKNNALPLIIMLVLLAALVIGYVVLSNYNEKNAENEAAEDETSTVEVVVKDKAILTEFSYGINGETFLFSYVSDEWIYPADENYPIDSDAVASAVSALTSVKAVSVVDTEGADTADFGLDKPTLTATVKYSDGTEYTFTFGIVNSFNGYQYMTCTGSDNIYMVETALADCFSYEPDDFYEDEVWKLSNDAVTAADVTSVLIETAEGTSVTVEYDETIEILFNLVYDLDLGTWEDYYADTAEMQESYGIYDVGTRVTLNYTTETTVTNDDGTTTTAEVPASYTVYLGNSFDVIDEESGQVTETLFMYSPAGSTRVYSADAEIKESILEYKDYVPPVEEETESSAKQ